MSGGWGPPSNPYQNSLGQWQSGALVEIIVTGTSAPNDCVRIIRIGDGSGSCGGAWGWSSFTWTQT